MTRAEWNHAITQDHTMKTKSEQVGCQSPCVFCTCIQYDPISTAQQSAKAFISMNIMLLHFVCPSEGREAAPRSRNFKIREIEILLGVCPRAGCDKNYAEVGAYNSSWIKSYEHRSKLFLLVPHLHDSHAFFVF